MQHTLTFVLFCAEDQRQIDFRWRKVQNSANPNPQSAEHNFYATSNRCSLQDIFSKLQSRTIVDKFLNKFQENVKIHLKR